jgi:molybdopterin biosynthesis enzyme
MNCTPLKRRSALIASARAAAAEVRAAQEQLFLLREAYNRACTAVVAAGGKVPSFYSSAYD